MAFTSYITYEEYKKLGGIVPEDTFPQIERKAQRWLDYFTFNRIQLLSEIPDTVKEVLTELINRLSNYYAARQSSDLFSAYSNGVETLTYKTQDENALKADFQTIITGWLPPYLTNRLVNFDVKPYIQSDSNDTE